jgi:hypothetical protein
MSEQESTTPATPSTTSGNSAVRWTVRVIVFGVLAALLVVAILEYRAKKQRGDSLSAIGDKLETPDAELTLKQAEELLVGSPETADGKTQGMLKKKIYTWAGPLQQHKIAIIYREVGQSTLVDKATPDAEETE